jgi:hypothetical protein
MVLEEGLRMKTRAERWEEIDASVVRARAVFHTLTSADWAREIARAKATPNAISARIRGRLLDVGKNKLQPGENEEKAA